MIATQIGPSPPAGSVTRTTRLSKLQKYMLERARENRANEGRTSSHEEADLYTWEVLAEFYGFETRPAKCRDRQPHVNIRRTSNNAAQIRCAEAAISRAVRRLEDRKLIVRYSGKSNLAGIRLASGASPEKSR